MGEKLKNYDDGKGYEDLTDMPVGDYPTMSDLAHMADERSPLDKLKEKLPMLYTARGNIIKRKSRVVTGKNFADHRKAIDTRNVKGNPLIFIGDGWTLEIDTPTSDLLRDFEQVEGLYLAGWEISLI